MSQNKPTISHLYTPENQTKEELIENFVIRNKEFKRIYKDIQGTPLDESPQHYLIEGQRGTGKTSLMLRIRYEIENQSKKNDGNTHLLPVQLPEEQYGVFDLCRLWEHIADYLHEEPDFENLADELDKQAEQKDYPNSCFNTLDDFLVRNNKRLILFLDNFGDMLNKFSDIEQKRLRDIFHTSKHIQLIAASAQTLEATYKHDQPFFEFFKILRLKNLNPKEATTLLQQLAIRYDTEDAINQIIKNEPQRIETIRILTGGVPRTIALLFEVFLDKNTKIFEDLESLLDRVTPLYKHRMDDLKRNQQAIMDVIALNWDGISTAEIVARLKGRGFDNKKVSAQLKALEQNDLVSSKKVDKKNKIYFIRERFFNIWYLMRLGRRSNGDRVRWLVQFLNAWYTPDDIQQRIKEHISQAKLGELNPKGAFLMGEALSCLSNNLDEQDELLSSVRECLATNNTSLANQVSTSDKSIFELAEESFFKEDYEETLKQLKKLSKGYNGFKEFHTALVYKRLKDFNNAIKYYLLAIEKGDDNAIYNLALLYHTELKDFDNTIKYYLLAIDKNYVDAMNNLALLYETEFKDLDNAIKYYLLAIDKNYDNAMNNLALLYETEFKDFDNAIKYYYLAIENNNVDAMHNLAALYIEQNKTNKIKHTIKLAKKCITLNPKYTTINTLATALLWGKQYKASDKTIRRLVKDYKHQRVELSEYFIFLLMRKQHHSAYALFQDFPALKDELKPIYYALMTLMKEEYPKEYLKMGEEIESTVEQILKRIEDMRAFYDK